LYYYHKEATLVADNTLRCVNAVIIFFIFSLLPKGGLEGSGGAGREGWRALEGWNLPPRIPW